MNANQKAKIVAFLNDELASDAVFSALQESFLKDRGSKETTYLAASTLAVHMLRQAWNDLERYRPQEKREVNPHNPGL